MHSTDNDVLNPNANTIDLYIIKRSGERVPFNGEKIENAIKKANLEEGILSKRVKEEDVKTIVSCIEKEAKNAGRDFSVEEIQDKVVDYLMDYSHSVAHLYDIYRYIHNEKRQMSTLEKKIAGVVHRTNEEVKEENSNKNPVILSVQRDYIAGEVSRDYSGKYIFPKESVDAHNEGIIHIHDMDYAIEDMHNCFTGGTKFITDKGIVQFRNFKDGDPVYVKDLHGEIRLATVHKYGKQQMQEVTLENGKKTRTIKCTKNHRWVLKDGSVTENLKVGDNLYQLEDSTKINIKNVDDARAFCIGFIIGDGFDHDNHVEARLCGEKTKYAKYFAMAGYSTKDIKNSKDIRVYSGRAFKQDFLNCYGWRFMTPKHKALAFKGYYAADGAKQNNRSATSDTRVETFIEETSGMAGYYITSRKEIIHDTPYKNNARLVYYYFMKSQPENQIWKVTDISPCYSTKVDAYCVEEPVTHTFTLEGGVVTGNCDLVNLEDMLQNGTCISGIQITKPHSFRTACNITSQIIAQIASSQYGGQSVNLADLVPFIQVSREKITKEVHEELDKLGISDERIEEIVQKRLNEEIVAGVQTMQYQLVTLMTTNGQTPFVTLFMYLKDVPEGQAREDYVSLIKEVFIQRIKGLPDRKGNWVTPAFPKLIYVLEDDNIHEGDKYYDLTVLAAKCTAKRMVPDYISEKKMLELKGDVYACMGCRSFLTPDRFTDKGIGNISNAGNYTPGKHKYYGRFNQGVVTLNLVDIACSSGKDEDKFWDIMKERLNLCHKTLRVRHEKLLGVPSDVAPILWQDGALARLKPGETIDELLYHGYSTISLGYAGLAECVYYMKGVSHTSDIGREFGLKVMQAMNDACKEWKEAEDIDYSVYGTPLESTTYKFAKCLQKRFGIIPRVTDKNYITNSYHIHVTEEIDAFSKLTKEAEFQALSPGGAISYVEVPNMQDNIPAVLAVLKHIYETILYAELNTKSDFCAECGYDGEIQIVTEEGKLIWKCPNCGNTNQDSLHVARRTCGYIGSNFWNQGRTQEIKERVLHL